MADNVAFLLLLIHIISFPYHSANARMPRGIPTRMPHMAPNNLAGTYLPRVPPDTNETVPRRQETEQGQAGWRLEMSAQRFPADMREALERSSRRLRQISVAAGSGSYAGLVTAGDGAFLTGSTATGEPAVAWTALVDTGSDLVWRQCRPCERCYGTNAPVFNPLESVTFRRVRCGSPTCALLPDSSCRQPEYVYRPFFGEGYAGEVGPTCSYVYRYGDGSFTAGDLVADTLTLPDGRGRPAAVAGFVFGCGHDNENSDFSGADGIMGLGRGPLSLPSQLRVSRFSYCLQSMVDPPSRTSPLFLGSAAIASTDSVSTPLVQNSFSPSFYYVRLSGVSVAGVPAPIPSNAFSQHGVIFDSGTTLTYLSRPAFSAIAASFRSLILQIPVSVDIGGGDSLLCYERSPLWVPPVVFHFEGGANMELPVQNYMVSVGGDAVCLAIAPSDDISIIGNIQQQNFHIVYNLQEERLSFASVACDTL